jgi:hypothetical protein
MPSLLESLSSSFGPDIVAGLGKAIGADSSAVTQALGAAGPLLLSGMSRMASTPAGAESLFKMLPQDTGMLGNIGSLLGGLLGGGGPGEGGASLLSSLFGQGGSAVTGSLSRALGFNVAPILGLVGPAALGAVAKLVKADGLDAAKLGATLKAQSEAFMGDPANRAAATLVTAAHEAGDQAKSVIAAFGADWSKVIAGPAAALAAVASADLSGPVGSIKEARAAADALALIARQAAPGSVLASAFGAGLTTEMLGTMKQLAPSRDGLIDLMRTGAAAVAAKSPADAAAYKDALLAVAKATAEASKDGGFLGIGGKLVSDDEQRALDAIKAALA